MKTKLAGLIGIFLSANSGLGLSAPSADDAFAEIDRMLAAQFEDVDRDLDKQYLRVEQAIQRAYQGLTEKIEVNWDDDVKLPTDSAWVTYSDDMLARIEVDYERGQYVLEALVGNDEAAMAAERLQELNNRVVHADQAALNQADSFLKAVATQSKDLEIDSGLSLGYEQVRTPTIAELVGESQINDAIDQLQSSKGLLRSIKKTQKKEMLRIELPMLSDYQQQLLKSYLAEIRELSFRYEIPSSTILAIIETESSFNPRATSPVPAFGLMQIVPRTAGIDAYNYVHGEKKVVSADFLYDASNNLLMGSAYFALLTSKYLRAITDPESRFYCAVASYNTGVGNLALTFGSSKDIVKAAETINRMTSGEVKEFLLTNLPAEETRNYLRKITKRVEKYRQFDGEMY